MALEAFESYPNKGLIQKKPPSPPLKEVIWAGQHAHGATLALTACLWGLPRL